MIESKKLGINSICVHIGEVKDEQFKGAFNAVSSEHISNLSFSKKISKIFNSPFLAIGAPSFILQIFFGEMSTIILNGSRISANKIKQAGFKFKFENLEKALNNLR